MPKASRSSSRPSSRAAASRGRSPSPAAARRRHLPEELKLKIAHDTWHLKDGFQNLRDAGGPLESAAQVVLKDKMPEIKALATKGTSGDKERELLRYVENNNIGAVEHFLSVSSYGAVTARVIMHCRSLRMLELMDTFCETNHENDLRPCILGVAAVLGEHVFVKKLIARCKSHMEFEYAFNNADIKRPPPVMVGTFVRQTLDRMDQVWTTRPVIPPRKPTLHSLSKGPTLLMLLDWALAYNRVDLLEAIEPALRAFKNKDNHSFFDVHDSVEFNLSPECWNFLARNALRDPLGLIPVFGAAVWVAQAGPGYITQLEKLLAAIDGPVEVLGVAQNLKTPQLYASALAAVVTRVMRIQCGTKTPTGIPVSKLVDALLSSDILQSARGSRALNCVMDTWLVAKGCKPLDISKEAPIEKLRAKMFWHQHQELLQH